MRANKENGKQIKNIGFVIYIVKIYNNSQKQWLNVCFVRDIIKFGYLLTGCEQYAMKSNDMAS